MAHPPTRLFRPSRRLVLRGGASLVTSAAAALAAREEKDGGGDGEGRALGRTLTAQGPGSDTDFPGAVWAPADAANVTRAHRPDDHPVEFVVIHVAQQTFEGTVGHFQNADSEVSAHYVVGERRVAQCVRESDIGWHAGNWRYNTRSIGIEHEGWIDDPAWFTEDLYRTSARLTAHLCATYGIPADRDHVIGHNEVPRATHVDPGPLWDWDRYMDLVTDALE